MSLNLMCVCITQDVQSWNQIATEMCGFVTVVGGTFLLHTTKDMDFTFQNLSAMTRSGTMTPKSMNLIGARRTSPAEDMQLMHPFSDERNTSV